jgi:hypothetical protein
MLLSAQSMHTIFCLALANRFCLTDGIANPVHAEIERELYKRVKDTSGVETFGVENRSAGAGDQNKHLQEVLFVWSRIQFSAHLILFEPHTNFKSS